MRRAFGEALVRLLLLCVAGAVLRWATVTLISWRENVSSTFEQDWSGWAGWLALVAAAGALVGVACLSGRPAGYRALVPLVISLPPLILLGHYVLWVESASEEGGELPWILGRYFFYMELTSQIVLAFVVGLGIAAGFRPRTATESSLGAASPPATATTTSGC